MANADIIVVGPSELGLLAALYNEMFKPRHDGEFFARRLRGRGTTLCLVAEIERRPVGFAIGFELKPEAWFHWMLAVLPDYRRQGIGAQLLEAEQAWVGERGYLRVRLECRNEQRPFLHLALARRFDVIGLTYDSERHTNLIILEKDLTEDPDG